MNVKHMSQSLFRYLIAIVALFLVSCGPEAKKKRAMEGGNKYYDKGQYKQARLMYLNAIKGDPRFGEAYYKLALTNLRLGNAGEAVGNLQRVVELLPDNMDAHSKLADIYLTAYASNPTKFKGLMKDIKELAAKMQTRGKGSYEDLRMQGFIALSDNDAERALVQFRAADKLRQDDPSLQVTMIRTMLVLKRVDEAIAYAKQMVDKNKTSAQGYEALYGIYLSQSKLDEGEKVLELRRTNIPKDSGNYLRLAAHYLGTRQSEKMEKVLAELQSKRAEYPSAYQDVGDFYYRIRSYDRAATAYTEGAKADPASKRGFEKRLIEVRVAQNRAQEALEMTERILKEDPKDPEAIAMRASLWLYAGKPEQINTAISELQSVVSKMPENFVLRYNLGRALMAKGDLDAARVQFADALRYRPDYIPARVALAQTLLSRGEFAAAHSAAGEILQLDPANQFARLIQAQAFLAQNKFNESRAVLETTLKMNPNNRDAAYQLGYVYFKEKRYKEAEGLFVQMTKLTPPDIRGVLGLAEVYEATNQADKALGILQAEIQKYPKAQILSLAWGNIAIRAKKFDEGIAAFKKVLEGDPKNFDVHMRIAEGYRQKKSLAEAIDYWKKAAELMPTHVSPVLFRAMALDEVNRKTEAAPLYEQVLKLEPDNAVALNNYSFYLADQGANLDLALTYAQKAKSKQPEDPMVADTLGYIYLKKNLPQNATSIFQDLTGKHPKIALFHIRLATAYFQSGQKEKARKALDDARKNNPTDTDKEQINTLAGRLG